MNTPHTNEKVEYLPPNQLVLDEIRDNLRRYIGNEITEEIVVEYFKHFYDKNGGPLSINRAKELVDQFFMYESAYFFYKTLREFYPKIYGCSITAERLEAMLAFYKKHHPDVTMPDLHHALYKDCVNNEERVKTYGKFLEEQPLEDFL